MVNIVIIIVIFCSGSESTASWNYYLPMFEKLSIQQTLILNSKYQKGTFKNLTLDWDGVYILPIFLTSEAKNSGCHMQNTHKKTVESAKEITSWDLRTLRDKQDYKFPRCSFCFTYPRMSRHYRQCTQGTNMQIRNV